VVEGQIVKKEWFQWAIPSLCNQTTFTVLIEMLGRVVINNMWQVEARVIIDDNTHKYDNTHSFVI
jgi:hypothetical protein